MLSRFKRSAAYVPSKELLEIVGDGLISTAGVGDGRMLPAAILDTSGRADVEEYFRVHAGSAVGDVRVQWAYSPEQDSVILMLSVERPLAKKLYVAFRLAKRHGVLVEQVLAMNGLYIQSGRIGDRVGTTLDRQRILFEIPDTGFRKTWDKMFLKHTAKSLRERGIARNRAKEAAKDVIGMLRKTGEFRFP